MKNKSGGEKTMRRASSVRTLTRSLLTRQNHHRSDSVTTTGVAEAEEVKKINELLPRLCESNHLHEAIRLTDTLLLTNPPLESISDSLHILLHRLSEEPTMTQSMSLLNRLKHTCPPFLPHITQLLIASYLDKKKLKEAIKIFRWVSRPDSPCDMGAHTRMMLVKAMCENYMTVDALVIVKKMVEDKVVVEDEIREWVYRSLLREARIKEAKELNQALVDLDLKDDSSWRSGVVELLDTIIQDWTD